MESYSNKVDQLANYVKSLKESHDNLLKKVNDLEKLMVSQNQNKPQNELGMQSNSNSENVGNDEEPNFENPFCFEQPLNKIKLEDQSEEIQKLNQVIKDLKEENLTLTVKYTKLSKQNEEMQIQSEAMIKNLKEENSKLTMENSKVSVENAKLSKENAKISKNDKSHLRLFQRFSCDVCNRVFMFTSSEMLNEHQIQCKLTRIMRISCRYCFKFVRKSEYNDHLKKCALEKGSKNDSF